MCDMTRLDKLGKIQDDTLYLLFRFRENDECLRESRIHLSRIHLSRIFSFPACSSMCITPSPYDTEMCQTCLVFPRHHYRQRHYFHLS